jgi:class 3 adenylate cyclase/predicted ATPase
LFCDLENSTELSDRLDPEELREIIAAYQQACATVVRRFEGFIARYFGDGILVYFGFPRAHEDEAQRAVRTGLGIREAVMQLSSRLERDHGVPLHARIGIHTGLVVAGDITGGEALESMAAIGDTPNIAARLQALAAPDSVVISSSTNRLIVGYFHCRELGPHDLRGISKPVDVYEVLNETAARTRLDVFSLAGLPPMVGRGRELDLLNERWHRAVGGEGQAILIIGEPGIGKSRLIRELEEQVAHFPDSQLATLTCSPYFQNTAFYPITEYFQRSLEFNPDATPDQRLDRLDGFLAQYGFSPAQLSPLMADLMSLPVGQRYPPLAITPDRRRRLIMEMLVQIVLLRAGHQPLLLVCEDLHWADPSTLEVLARLLQLTGPARILVVLSSRENVAAKLPAARLEMTRLDAEASRTVVAQTAGRPLPADVLQQVLQRADGVPLYLEELARFVVESSPPSAEMRRSGEVASLNVPASLADSIAARLDQFSASKRTAQLGATIGRQFSYDLLTAVLRRLGRLNQTKLRRELAQLVDADLLTVQSEAGRTSYRFKHALIQDGAYASLLRRTRRDFHRAIAQQLVAPQPGTPEVVPELVAHHFTEAGLMREAVPWWLKAGQRAMRGSAYQEAIAQLESGLQLLAQIPPGIERSAQELELRLSIGPAYMATRGYGAPQVEDCYRRARELCQELGNPPKLAPVVYGLWSYHIVRAQHWTALELAQRILAIGEAAGDDALRVQGHLATGWSQFFLGRLVSAREHLEKSLELCGEELQPLNAYMVDDPATSASSCLAFVYWFLGYQDRARRTSDESVARLRSNAQPYNAAFGLIVNGFQQAAIGEFALTRSLSERTIDLSIEHSLPLTASMGHILHGYCLVRTDALDAGVTEMREALSAYIATGAGLAMPYWYFLLADASYRAGAYDAALDYIVRSEEALTRTGEAYFEAELYRLHGDIVQQLGGWGGAENSSEQLYLRAISVATDGESRSLELRARIQLARLVLARDRPEEAQRILHGAYNWFTEGFEMEDLRNAKSLLELLENGAAIQTGTFGSFA